MASLALLTVAEGVGVTFGALGFLCLCAWLAARRGGPSGAGAPKAAPTASPVFAPTVAAPAPASEPTSGAEAAAAIAVGLYLAGATRDPAQAVAAAIAAAFALEARGRSRPEAGSRDAGWKTAGRLEGLRRWQVVRPTR